MRTIWARKPDDLSFEEAGGFSVVVETATRILAQVGAKAGETLLVSGASGGIGSAVIQFARHRGITVIGTASARNHDSLRGLGAIPTSYELASRKGSGNSLPPAWMLPWTSLAQASSLN